MNSMSALLTAVDIAALHDQLLLLVFKSESTVHSRGSQRVKNQNL